MANSADRDAATGPWVTANEAEGSAGAERSPDEPAAEPIRREKRGHFAKGYSANPAGRPPGSLNEATRAAAALLNGEAAGLTRIAIDLAKADQPLPLKLCLDPILAPLKKQPAAFALPPVAGPDDLPAACAAVSEAAAAGLLTPAEAASLAQMLEAQARTLVIGDRLRADRLIEQKEEVSLRFDLGAAVVVACRVCEIRLEAQKVDDTIAELCLPIESLGDDALRALRRIPYTRDARCRSDLPGAVSAAAGAAPARDHSGDRKADAAAARLPQLGGEPDQPGARSALRNQKLKSTCFSPVLSRGGILAHQPAVGATRAATAPSGRVRPWSGI
jgi:hypothetical protein